MSGSFGKSFAFLKYSASLYSSSDYFSRFRLSRTPAKLFIEVPMSGLFGKSLSFLNFRTSL
jgi:hypothetical protein